jgi:hypothetical protein
MMVAAVTAATVVAAATVPAATTSATMATAAAMAPASAAAMRSLGLLLKVALEATGIAAIPAAAAFKAANAGTRLGIEAAATGKAAMEIVESRLLVSTLRRDAGEILMPEIAAAGKTAQAAALEIVPAKC